MELIYYKLNRKYDKNKIVKFFNVDWAGCPGEIDLIIAEKIDKDK